MKLNVTLSLKYIFTYSSLLIPNENDSFIKSPYNTFSFNFDTKTNLISNNDFNLELNYDNVYNLFLMSYNAYYNLNDSNWNKIPFDTNFPIIEHNKVKGYVFSNENNSINFLAFKGTSLWAFPDGKSSFNDKFNDNLFYSCCFYKQSSIFKNYVNKTECENEDDNDKLIFQNDQIHQIESKTRCFKKCYDNTINYELNYLTMTENAIEKLRMKKLIDFENALIIFTGHSLGGTVSTYLGLKYSKQVFTFQTPGNKHYFDIMKDSMNFNYTDDDLKNIYNFGHNSDAIMNGNCGTTCWLFGYSIYTKCHLGNKCIYDSKTKLGISESINSHRLAYIHDNIITYWKDDFPECEFENKCEEDNCKTWELV